MKFKLSTSASVTMAVIAAILSIGGAQTALALVELRPILDEINADLEELGVDREIACPERLQRNGCDPIDAVPDTVRDTLCNINLQFC